MLQAIFLKEFLKTRYVIYIFAILFSLSLFGIFFSLKSLLEHQQPTSILMSIVFKQDFDYHFLLEFIPVFALILACFQYYPEITKARVRLHLHLPLSKSFLVASIIAIGFGILLSFFLLIEVLFYFSITHFFPIEVYLALNSNLLPVFLEAFIIYLCVGIAFVSPKLPFKIAIVVFTLLLSMYFSKIMGKFFKAEYLNLYMLGIIGIYTFSLFNAFRAYTKGYIKWDFYKNTF